MQWTSVKKIKCQKPENPILLRSTRAIWSHYRHAQSCDVDSVANRSKSSTRMREVMTMTHDSDNDTYGKHMAFCNGGRSEDPAAVSKVKYHV